MWLHEVASSRTRIETAKSAMINGFACLVWVFQPSCLQRQNSWRTWIVDPPFCNKFYGVTLLVILFSVRVQPVILLWFERFSDVASILYSQFISEEKACLRLYSKLLFSGCLLSPPHESISGHRPSIMLDKNPASKLFTTKAWIVHYLWQTWFTLLQRVFFSCFMCWCFDKHSLKYANTLMPVIFIVLMYNNTTKEQGKCILFVVYY
jgi:hypothetical protein